MKIMLRKVAALERRVGEGGSGVKELPFPGFMWSQYDLRVDPRAAGPSEHIAVDVELRINHPRFTGADAIDGQEHQESWAWVGRERWSPVAGDYGVISFRGRLVGRVTSRSDAGILRFEFDGGALRLHESELWLSENQVGIPPKE